MVEQTREHLDKLFYLEVNELENLGKKVNRTNHDLLKMAHILRKLTIDGLAFTVAKNYKTPLTVLVPEPSSGNTPPEELPSVPENVVRYACEISEQTHPMGKEAYYHKPYPLQKYLNQCQFVFVRAVTVRELVLFLANKLGGSHADTKLVDLKEGGRSVDAEALNAINQSFIIYGEKSIYNQFFVASSFIWRALAPLRDEVLDHYKVIADIP